MIREFVDVLPELDTAYAHAWYIGCGEGYKAYSIGGAQKTRYLHGVVKVWAHDEDVLNDSRAPTFTEDKVPDSLHRFVVDGPNGLSFNEEIADSMYFEYRDVSHDNTFSEVMLVVVRDVPSFIDGSRRAKALTELCESSRQTVYVLWGRMNGFLWNSGNRWIREIREYIQSGEFHES